MARIFYRVSNGQIYGVHPGPHEGNPKITLPIGVAWIDVAEAPDAIAWPDPGGETWNRVNPATQTLEALPLPETEQENRVARTLALPNFSQIDNAVESAITAAQGGNWTPLETLLKRLAKITRILARNLGA